MERTLLRVGYRLRVVATSSDLGPRKIDLYVRAPDTMSSARLLRARSCYRTDLSSDRFDRWSSNRARGDEPFQKRFYGKSTVFM